MVDTTDYTESNYVRASPEWNGKTIVIIDEPVFIESKAYAGKKQLIANVQCDGKNYKLCINRINARRLSQAWGVDSKNWVGKLVQVSTAAAVVEGQIKQVLLLTPK